MVYGFLDQQALFFPVFCLSRFDYSHARHAVVPRAVYGLDTGSDTGSTVCLTYPFSLPVPDLPSESFSFYAVFPMVIFHSHASIRFYAVLPIGIFRVVIGSILYLIWSFFLFDSWGSQRIP